jgi:hypothetical protein
MTKPILDTIDDIGVTCSQKQQQDVLCILQLNDKWRGLVSIFREETHQKLYTVYDDLPLKN